MNKVKFYNNYDFSGPNNGFLSPASGASDDFAFGTLGTASMTLELGTEFRQSCSYFNNNVDNKNRQALTYAAKTSIAPYRLPKGPDITSLTIVSIDDDEEKVQVTASASDSAYASVATSSFPTTRQAVAEIKVFSVYPNGDDAVGQIMTQNGNSGESFTTTLDISNLDFDQTNNKIKRPMLFVQATDTDGYVGPVTAVFLPKNDATPPAVITASPSSTPTLPSSGFSCFSGRTKVQVSNGEYKKMSDLKLGDEVRVLSDDNAADEEKPNYEAIYSFGHFAPQTIGDFISINHGVLELTPQHMVLLSSKPVSSSDDEKKNHNLRWIPAQSLKVGDALVSSTREIRIHSIQPVSRQGVYSPFTPSGTIVVGEQQIIASSYISLQSYEEYLHIFDRNTGLSFQWLAHTFESGHRLYVHLTGSKKETYTLQGISTWVAIPHEIMNWALKQHSSITIMILMPTMGTFFMLSVVEILLLSCFDVSFSFGVVMVTTLLLLLFVLRKRQTKCSIMC